MRVIFAIPAELKANWVFQLSEADGRKECLSGVRKAMFVFGVVPLFAALAPIYVFLWGWPVALFHTFFDIALSLLLIELLLVKFHESRSPAPTFPGNPTSPRSGSSIGWVSRPTPIAWRRSKPGF